jgi:protein-tyrosine phosphatase
LQIVDCKLQIETCNPQSTICNLQSGMIDLHSHILYGLDDGTGTLEEALAFGRYAAADGIRVIAATPHSPGSTACRNYDPVTIQQRLDILNAALAAEDVPLEVVAGTEIYYDGDVLDRLKKGALLPYAHSQTILLELPHGAIPPLLDTVLFNLQIAGYRIVLAHPERLPDVQHDPNRLLPLITRGVLMQLTAAALTGEQGARLQAIAETLLTHGMVHLLASDAHGLPPRRPPALSAALARAAELIGPAAANGLVTTTPAAILQHQPLPLPPPRPVAHHGRRWRG